MEKKGILVVMILIALIALIGFNFEKITGSFVKNKFPIVGVYKTNFPEQNELKAGDPITIQVKVGEYCVNPKISFYFAGKTYAGEIKPAGVRQATVTQKGHFKLCKGDAALDDKNTFTLDYKTKPDWDGDYYARVYYWKDRTTEDYVNAYFRVKPKEK